MTEESQSIPFNKITMALVAVIAVVVIVLSLQSRNNIGLANEEKTRIHANAVANQISEIIIQASTITAHLSESREVRALMAVGSAEEIQAWTIRTRKLFPHIDGLSLSNNAGEIIGDLESQRIGRLCERDLNVFVRGGKVPYPPVHQNKEKLEHFDILKKIRNDEGEDVGVLLARYPLSLMQGMIDRIAEEGHYYQLLFNGQDTPVERGKRGLPYTIKLMIPGADWELVVSSDPRP